MLGERRRPGRADDRGRRARLLRQPVPDRARHRRRRGGRADGARPPALRARRLAPRRRRPELPPLLRGQHPRRPPGRGAVGVRRVARRDPRLGAPRPRRRAADRPSGRPRRPGRLPGPPRRGDAAAPYVLVEKILEGDEPLPDFWATDGTTGYDALGDFDRRARRPGRRAAARPRSPRGSRTTPSTGTTSSTRPSARSPTASCTPRCSASCGRACGGRTRTRAASPTRSASCSPASPSTAPTCRSARPTSTRRRPRRRRRRPDLATEVAAVVRLLKEVDSPISKRFQQTSGMVMAKGVEDNAFYRYSRLTSLTEVGGEPNVFSEDVDALPRPHGRAAGAVARGHDDAVDARHEARRGRPRPDRRAGRGADRVGRGARRARGRRRRSATRPSRTCSGRRPSAPGRSSATGCTPTPRRPRGRPASPRPGPRPTRSSRRGCTPRSTCVYDDDDVHALVERLATSLAAAGLVELPRP